MSGDDDKAEANIDNHNCVTFFEAVTSSVIHCRSSAMTTHSIGEQRFLTIGRSNQDRILIVSYTERGDVIRIISAREAEPKEIRAYEEG